VARAVRAPRNPPPILVAPPPAYGNKIVATEPRATLRVAAAN
jgi:hypothetical protein